MDEAASPSLDFSGYGNSATWTSATTNALVPTTEFDNSASIDFDGSASVLTAGLQDELKVVKYKNLN